MIWPNGLCFAVRPQWLQCCMQVYNAKYSAETSHRVRGIDFLTSEVRSDAPLFGQQFRHAQRRSLMASRDALSQEQQ